MAKQPSFLDRLTQLLGNLTKPVSNSPGKPIQKYTPQVFKNSLVGKTLSGINNYMNEDYARKKQVTQNVLIPYAQNKYIKPAQGIFDPSKSKLERGLDALITGLNVLPTTAPGMAGLTALFSAKEGIQNAIGAYKAKKPVLPALREGFVGNEAQDLGSLITKNPYAAGAINVADFAAPLFMGKIGGAEGEVLKAEQGAKSIENLLSKLKFTTKEGEQFNLQGKKITDLIKKTTKKSEAILPELEKTAPKTETLLSKVKSVAPKVESDLLPWETVGESTLQRISRVKNTVPLTIEKGTQKIADIVTGKFTNGKLDKNIMDDFANYVNKVRASSVEGLIKRLEFADLDSKGLQGIVDFQAGLKTGRFADVARYLDDKFASNKKVLKNLEYQKNYLPQLWNNTPEEIQKVFGNRISRNPSFTFSKVIPDYVTGIKAGLSPKFETVGELVGWYEKASNKAVADVTYFERLAKDNLIMPKGKAPLDWVTLSEDRFPKLTTTYGGHTYSGSYKAPPDLAKLINNYLNPGADVARIPAEFATRAKNITLSFGVPNPIAGIKSMLQGGTFSEGAGTGINAHGINIAVRHILGGTGGNPISRFLEVSKNLLNPGAAEKVLTENLHKAPAAIKNGLTLSVEEHTALLNEAETVAKSLGKNWNTIFERPLFNKIIPSLKLNSYENLVNGGMDAKEAAKVVNNVYGGINWEAMGRSKDSQNILRSLILAPDWAETTLRLGGNMAKSLVSNKSATSARYRAMSATLMASYVAANVANKATSGHYMYENDAGHTFEIEAGYTSDGQKRYLRPYGTAADFVRIPYDIALALVKGDSSVATRVIANRLSMPFASVVHLLSNTDYLGKPISGKDRFGQPIPFTQGVVGQGEEVLGAIGFPSFLKNAADVAVGKQGLEQGLTQGFELPFRYSGGAYSNAQKQAGQYLDGASGKEKYDMYKLLQGQDSLSPNQMDIVDKSSPQDRRDYFINRINTLKKKADQKKELQSMKVEATGTTDPTVLNNTVIAPKGGVISISDLLAKDKQASERYSLYKAIVNRSGNYQYLAKSDSATQDQLQQNGFTPQEVQTMQYKQIAGLDTKDQAKAAYALLQQGTPFDTLVENKIMTTAVAKEMQRQFGVSADALTSKIEQTDPYWVQEQMKKSNIKYLTKMNKLNNDFQLKNMKLILESKRTKTKLPKAKKIKIPKLKTSISSSKSIRDFLSANTKVKKPKLPKLRSYKSIS